MTEKADEHASVTNRSYDRIADRYLRRWRDRSPIRPMLERFASDLPADAVVLDLGCGPGFDGAWLREQGFDAFGLDRSSGMLNSGRSEYDLPRVQGDMRALPLATQGIDGVWASASLLHLERDALPDVLAELARVIRKGGHLAISVKRGRGERWDDYAYGTNARRFFTFWRAEDLDAAIDRSGFSIERSEDAFVDGGGDRRWLVRHTRRR